jgi:hypothetical protein
VPLDTEVDDAMLQAADQKAQANHPVADDHDGRKYRIPRQGTRLHTTRQHHRDDQRQLDDRDGKCQNQGAKRLPDTMCNHFCVVYRNEHRGDQGRRGTREKESAGHQPPDRNKHAACRYRDGHAPDRDSGKRLFRHTWQASENSSAIVRSSMKTVVQIIESRNKGGHTCPSSRTQRWTLHHPGFLVRTAPRRLRTRETALRKALDGCVPSREGQVSLGALRSTFSWGLEDP